MLNTKKKTQNFGRNSHSEFSVFPFTLIVPYSHPAWFHPPNEHNIKTVNIKKKIVKQIRENIFDLILIDVNIIWDKKILISYRIYHSKILQFTMLKHVSNNGKICPNQ